MIDLELLLGRPGYEALMRALVRGKYHVLLGAGASYGATNQHGQPLPLGSQLATEIAEQFDLPATGDIGVRRIYAAAAGKISKSGSSLSQFMQERFIATVPPPWMQRFVRYTWEFVWTLNIDDCLERASNQAGTAARQRYLSSSWTERHRTPRTGQDELVVVHLHGKASRAQKEGELIFDISAYINAASDPHRWHAIFGDEYPTKPFLVLGASLNEELDLQAILDQGKFKSTFAAPSLIVNRDIDDFTAAEYRSYGLVPVAATAEEFFEAIDSDLARFVSEITPTESESLSQVAPEAIAFSRQWARLDSNAPSRRDRKHDFYAGHEPTWHDQRSDLIVKRAIEAGIRSSLLKPQPAGASAVVLLSGEMFSGKSSSLLSVAAALIVDEYEPYIFAGNSSIEIEAVSWWYQHHPRTVLLVDDAADFAAEIVDLVQEAEAAMLSFRILAVERSGRARGIRRELSPIEWESRDLEDTLSDAEIQAFIETLTAQHRAGVITDLPKREKIRYFTQRERKLFACMEGLERGRGFEERVSSEYSSISSAQEKRLVAVAAICAHAGYGLPLIAAPRAVGASVQSLVKLLASDSASDLLREEGDSIRLKHRTFGTLLARAHLPQEELFELLTAIVDALSPHLSPAAIKAKTLPYRIIREVMRHEFLTGLLRDPRLTLEWYEGVSKDYAWNARFWEQRALAATEVGMYEPAYSWAKEAVNAHRDAYTLNTVGTVLMRRAVYEAHSGSWPVDSWEAAEASLREARSISRSDSEYPHETFFAYTANLIAKAYKRDVAVDEQLKSVWSNWRSSASLLDFAAQKRLSSILEEADARWRVAMGGAAAS